MLVFYILAFVVLLFSADLFLASLSLFSFFSLLFCLWTFSFLADASVLSCCLDLDSFFLLDFSSDFSSLLISPLTTVCSPDLALASSLCSSFFDLLLDFAFTESVFSDFPSKTL